MSRPAASSRTSVPRRGRANASPSATCRRTSSPETCRWTTCRADVAYGGAIYAFVPATRLGLRSRPSDLPELIDAGRAVKAALAGSEVAAHPEDPRLSGIYGTVIHEQRRASATTATSRLRGRRGRPLADRLGDLRADRAAGRTPASSATARRWRNDSIVGTSFTARVIGREPQGVITEVEGTAFRTGEHRFVLDPRDELGTGFVLR